MASGVSISTPRAPLMPFLAIVRYELRSLRASWLVRLWFVGALLVALLTLGAGWANVKTPPLLAALLVPFLVFPWFVPVMMLGISPVTGSRLDALADGILSRPITRVEYLWACWAARVVIVLGVFLVVMVPTTALVALSKRPPAADPLTAYGTVSALFLVCVVLAFQVTLGFLVGTLLRGPLLAAVVLMFSWVVLTVFLHNFQLEEFSTVSLDQALPTLLRTPWRTEKAGDEQAARQRELEDTYRQGVDFVNTLLNPGAAGRSPAAARPNRSDSFYEQGHYEDFSLGRVLLGYGLPMLLAMALSTWVFSRRDL